MRARPFLVSSAHGLAGILETAGDRLRTQIDDRLRDLVTPNVSLDQIPDVGRTRDAYILVPVDSIQ